LLPLAVGTVPTCDETQRNPGNRPDIKNPAITALFAFRFVSGVGSLRLMDLAVLPGRSQLPVTIDVAKPVESAAEAGRLVALGEDCEIGFADLG